MSAASFSRVLAFLRINGFSLTADLEASRGAVVNSCCVMEGTRTRVETLLRRLIGLDHIEQIVLFGCLAGVDCRSSGKVVAVPSKEIDRIDGCFEAKTPIRDVAVYEFEPLVFTPYQKRVHRGVKNVLISEGCDHRCAYCNIKNAKGATRSKPAAAICDEIAANLGDGPAEFLLLADDCGSYGTDIGSHIVALLSAVLALDPRVRVRLYNIFPGVLLEHADAFAAFLASGRLVHVNIPIQSGSQRVLMQMNRRYDIGAVLAAVERFRRCAPGAELHTHVLVNFPAEGEQDFRASLEAAARFDEVLFLDYSRNPLTPAGRLPGLDPGVRADRLRRVRASLNGPLNGVLVGA